MKICYRGQQVFLKSAESQRKNKTAKRRSKFSQGTRYLPLTKKVVTVIFSVIIIGITVIGCGFSKFEAETTGEKINKRIECLFYQLRRLAMVHTL